MNALLLTPVLLSPLVLAAHFLRGGHLLPLVASLGLLALPGVRRPWARRVLQAGLGLGALEWIRTLVEQVNARQLAGQDWHRLAAILGAVAVVAVVGVVALEAVPMRARFAPPAPAGRGDP